MKYLEVKKRIYKKPLTDRQTDTLTDIDVCVFVL